MTTAKVTFTSHRAAQDWILHSPTGPIGQHLTRIGNQVVNRAKVYANVVTGLMRSQITFRLEEDSGGLVGILSGGTNYSLWVHEGNGYYEGNPFLRLAVEDVLG